MIDFDSDLCCDWTRLHHGAGGEVGDNLTLRMNLLRHASTVPSTVHVQASIQFDDNYCQMLVEQGATPPSDYQVCPRVNCGGCKQGYRGQHFAPHTETICVVSVQLAQEEQDDMWELMALGAVFWACTTLNLMLEGDEDQKVNLYTGCDLTNFLNHRASASQRAVLGSALGTNITLRRGGVKYYPEYRKGPNAVAEHSARVSGVLDGCAETAVDALGMRTVYTITSPNHPRFGHRYRDVAQP